MSDKRTARARIAAHEAFDPIWMEGRKKTRGQRRTAAYQWLAKEMGLHPGQCHMRFMDFDQCQRVIALCAPLTCGFEDIS